MLRRFRDSLGAGDDKLLKRFLYTKENAARMTKRRRPDRFRHRPALATEFLDDDPVAGFQSRLEPIETARRIELGFGNRNTRMGTAGARRHLRAVLAAQRAQFVQPANLLARRKLFAGDLAARMRQRERMLPDIAVAQLASRSRRNELLHIEVARSGLRREAPGRALFRARLSRTAAHRGAALRADLRSSAHRAPSRKAWPISCIRANASSISQTCPLREAAA